MYVKPDTHRSGPGGYGVSSVRFLRTHELRLADSLGGVSAPIKLPPVSVSNVLDILRPAAVLTISSCLSAAKSFSVSRNFFLATCSLVPR
jgi:hypothetical protein